MVDEQELRRLAEAVRDMPRGNRTKAELDTIGTFMDAAYTPTAVLVLLDRLQEVRQALMKQVIEDQALVAWQKQQLDAAEQRAKAAEAVLVTAGESVQKNQELADGLLRAMRAAVAKACQAGDPYGAMRFLEDLVQEFDRVVEAPEAERTTETQGSDACLSHAQ